MIAGQIQKGEKMGRTLNEDDVLKEIDRWIGYLDEDMITRIKIGIKKLQSAQSEQHEDAVSRQAVYTVIEEVLYETTKGADNWYGLLNDGVRTLTPVQASPCEFCKHNDIADETVCLRCPAERREDE